MTMRPAAFAIPGDITTLTGGYIYERRLLEGLRAQGRDVRHLQLGESFPDPSPADLADAAAQFAALEPGRAVILDGFVSATIDRTALSKLRGPIVAMVHHPLALESGLDDARRKRLYRSERDNFAFMTHVLVPSPHTAAILTDRYGVPAGRITIARPGTDRRAARRRPSDPPMILSVGIQHPRKGHDVLLRALAELSSGLDWQAVLVGGRYDNAHATMLERLRRELGLEDRVRIAGRVSDDELSRLYGAASLFALATRYEGYGIVFDEALAHGLPIVSCRTGAVPDTVPPEAGHLVAPNDPHAFAAALARLIGDADFRAARAAAASRVAQSLPPWSETARIAGEVLDSLP